MYINLTKQLTVCALAGSLIAFSGFAFAQGNGWRAKARTVQNDDDQETRDERFRRPAHRPPWAERDGDEVNRPRRPRGQGYGPPPHAGPPPQGAMNRPPGPPRFDDRGGRGPQGRQFRDEANRPGYGRRGQGLKGERPSQRRQAWRDDERPPFRGDERGIRGLRGRGPGDRGGYGRCDSPNCPYEQSGERPRYGRRGDQGPPPHAQFNRGGRRGGPGYGRPDFAPPPHRRPPPPGPEAERGAPDAADEHPDADA